MKAIEAWLCRWLRVPPEPDPPPGHSGTARTFRAGRNYYRYVMLKWALTQFFTLVGIAWGATLGHFIINEPRLETFIVIAEVLAIVSFVGQLPITFATRRLDFSMRWYIVTDRSLRIREGIFHVDEKTISFANIQNIAVRQGPVQRLLGLADVEVKTAGGGGGEKQKGKGENPFAKDLHTAYFRGVDNANQIRDAIVDRLRGQKGSGLGDPDEEEPADVVAALRQEAVLLRAAAARIPPAPPTC